MSAESSRANQTDASSDANLSEHDSNGSSLIDQLWQSNQDKLAMIRSTFKQLNNDPHQQTLRDLLRQNSSGNHGNGDEQRRGNILPTAVSQVHQLNTDQNVLGTDGNRTKKRPDESAPCQVKRSQGTHLTQMELDKNPRHLVGRNIQKLPEESPVHQVARSLGVQSGTSAQYQPRTQVTHVRQVVRTPVIGSGYNQPAIGHLHQVSQTPGTRTHHNQPAVQAYGEQRLGPGHQGTPTPVIRSHDNQPAVQVYGNQRLSPGHHVIPTPGVGPKHSAFGVQVNKDQRLSEALVQNHFVWSLSQTRTSSPDTDPSMGQGALRLQNSPPLPTSILQKNWNSTWEEQCRRQYEIISQGISMSPAAVRSVHTVQQSVSPVQGCIPGVPTLTMASNQCSILEVARNQPLMQNTLAGPSSMTRSYQGGYGVNNNQPKTSQDQVENQVRQDLSAFESYMRGESSLALLTDNIGADGSSLLANAEAYKRRNETTTANQSLAELHVPSAYNMLQQMRRDRDVGRTGLKDPGSGASMSNMQSVPSGIRKLDDHGILSSKDSVPGSGRSALNMQEVASRVRNPDDAHNCSRPGTVRHGQVANQYLTEYGGAAHPNQESGHRSVVWFPTAHQLEHSSVEVCKNEPAAAKQVKLATDGVAVPRTVAARAGLEDSVSLNQVSEKDAGNSVRVTMSSVVDTCIDTTLGKLLGSKSVAGQAEQRRADSEGRAVVNTTVSVVGHPPAQQQVRSVTRPLQSRTETSQSKRHSDSPKVACISYTCPICSKTFTAYPFLQVHMEQSHLSGQGTNLDGTAGTVSLDGTSADHTSRHTYSEGNSAEGTVTDAAPCEYTQATDDSAALGTFHEGSLVTTSSKGTASEATSPDGTSSGALGGIPPAVESSVSNDISCENEKKMTCLKCGRFFSDVEELSNHVQTVHHKRKSEGTPGSSEESGAVGTSTLESDPLDIFRDFNAREPDPAPLQAKFTCGVCLKQFVRQGNLDLHMKTICAQRLPKCPDCKKSFSDMEDLRIHRILCCLTDGAKEAKSGNSERGVPGRTLRNGAKREEKKKITWRCSKCGTSFRERWMLTKHVLVKHQQKVMRKNNSGNVSQQKETVKSRSSERFVGVTQSGEPKYGFRKRTLSDGKMPPATSTEKRDQEESMPQPNYSLRKSTFIERKRLARSRVDMQRENFQRHGRSASSGYALRKRALKILAKSKQNAIAKRQNASGTSGKPVKSRKSLRNVDKGSKGMAVSKTLNSSRTSVKSKPSTATPGRKPKTTNGQKTSKTSGKQGKSTLGSYSMTQNTNLLEEDLSCSLCGKVFTRCDTVIKHQTVCRRTCSRLPGQRLLRCLKCRRLFMGKDALRQHKMDAHVCGVCGQVFLRPGALVIHRKNHIRDGEMEMNQTGGGGRKQKRPQLKATKASSSKTLPASSKMLSGNATKAAKSHGSSSDTEKRRFVCKTCGKTYFSSQFLWIHEKIHTLAKSDIPMVDNRYVCKTCGETFKRSSNLLVHSRIHVSIGIFTCSGCGSGFQSSGACLNHARACNFSYQTNNNSQKSSEYRKQNMNNSDVHLTPVVSLQEVDGSCRDPSQQASSFANGQFVCSGCGDFFLSAHLCLLHGKVCDQLYYLAAENEAQDGGSGKIAARDDGGSTSKNPITNIKQERGTVDDLLDALVGDTGTIEVNLWSRSRNNLGPKVCEKLRLQRDGVDKVVEKLQVDGERRNSISGAEPQGILNISVKKEKDDNPLKDTAHSFKCKYCGRCYTKLSKLYFHQVQTGCKRLHSCSCCGELFTDVIQHIKHELTHESLSKAVRKLMEERFEEFYCPVPKSYMCGKCGKLFSKYVKCLRHRVIYHAAGGKNKIAAKSSSLTVANRKSSNILQCSESTLPMQSPDDTGLFGGLPNEGSQESNYSSDDDIFNTGLDSVGLSDDEQGGEKDADDTGRSQESPNEKSQERHEQDSRLDDMDMGLDSVGSSEDRQAGVKGSDNDDEKSTKFQCTACERSFGRRCELGRHEQLCEMKLNANKEKNEIDNRSFNRPTKLCCKPCGISFHRVSELRMHKESCNKTTVTVQKTKEVEDTEKCSGKEIEPNTRTRNERGVENRTEQDKRSVNDKESGRLQCETCKRTCMTFYALREHERACRTKLTDKMEQSDESRNVQGGGKKRQQSVTSADGKKFVRLQCERTFKTTPALRKHGRTGRANKRKQNDQSPTMQDGNRNKKRARNVSGNRSVSMQCKTCKQHFKSLRGLHIHENTCKLRPTGSTDHTTKRQVKKSAQSVDGNSFVSKGKTNVQRARNVRGSKTKVRRKTRSVRKVAVRGASSRSPKKTKATSTNKNKDKNTSVNGKSSRTPKKNKAASTNKNKDMDTSDDAEWYKCNVCNGSFVEKAGFDFHVKICIPSFQCMVCGVIFRKEATWIDHMGTHDDVTYWCSKCKKSYEDFSVFRQHEKACVEICIHCGKKAQSKEECVKHEVTCKKRPK